MDISKKEQLLLDFMNEIFKAIPPLTYTDFNRKFLGIDKESIFEVEKKYPFVVIGIGGTNVDEGTISIVGMMASITGLLLNDKRLAFAIEEGTDLIVGFCYYEVPETERVDG